MAVLKSLYYLFAWRRGSAMGKSWSFEGKSRLFRVIWAALGGGFSVDRPENG